MGRPEALAAVTFILVKKLHHQQALMLASLFMMHILSNDYKEMDRVLARPMARLAAECRNRGDSNLPNVQPHGDGAVFERHTAAWSKAVHNLTIYSLFSDIYTPSNPPHHRSVWIH